MSTEICPQLCGNNLCLFFFLIQHDKPPPPTWSQALKGLVFSFYCAVTWMVCKELWPQPYPRCLGWTRAKNEPELITRHQCWTSVLLLWLNVDKCQEPDLKIWWKDWNQQNGGFYTSKLVPMILKWDISWSHKSVMFGFQHNFDFCGQK